MQSRVIRWRRLFISSLVGVKPARRRSRSRFGSSGNLEMLEVRQLLSATAFATPNSTQSEDLSAEQLAIAEHVQSLSTSQFRTLTAEQAPLLSQQQIHGLGNRSAFQRIPLEGRQALTADQVSWLRVHKTGLQGLTNDQIDDLTTEQVQSLKVRDLRSLTPSQIPNLSAVQTSRLSALHQLRKLAEESRGALTGDQIRMLDIARSRLDLLTEEQIAELSIAQLEDVRRKSDVEMLSSEQHEIRSMMAAGMEPPARPASTSAMTVFSEMPVGNRTVGEIRALTYRHFEYLSAEQTPYLSLEQVATIPNGWYLGRIPEAARFALTKPQVQALNVSDTGLSALAVDQISELSEAQIQSLNYREFERLAPQQIPLLSADQLSTIPNSWWFGRLSDDARSVLTAAQVQALRVDNLGLSGLTPTQVAVLALNQIQSLSFREFQYLTEAQTPLLSTDQVATIPNSWWFGRMSVEARAAITPEQVRSLAVAEVGVGSLTLEQVRALSREQIQSLGYREFGYLTAEQIVDLTTEQVSSIPNEWWFTRSPEEARAAMTGDQVRALNVSEIHLGALTESQRAEIGVEQIQSLTYRDFRYLNASQTPLLTTDQIATIPNSWWFGKISEEARAALSPEQVQALDVSVTGVSRLTPEQASQLTPEQVQALGYRDIERLDADQIIRLSAEQLLTIPNQWWFERIPEDSRAALTDAQVQSLDVGVLGLGSLTTEQIAVLTTSQVQSVGYREFERLNTGQSPLLTAEQLATIPNQWWFERIPEDVRAALIGDQIRTLDVAAVGLSGLTAEQIAELSAVQVKLLSYRNFEFLTAAQTPELTAEQLQTIPNEWWFYRMSDSARAALTEAQVQTLDVAVVRLVGLTDQQVSWLTVSQIQTLSYRDFDRLDETQITHLTGDQITSIQNGWYFKGISEVARYSLTDEQVQSLNVAAISIGYISPAQRNALTVEQIQSLTQHDFKYLTADQVVHLTRAQMGSISNKWYFLRMSDAARAALSQDQLLALPNAVHAGLNHQPTALFAPTEDHGPMMTVVEMAAAGTTADHDHDEHDHTAATAAEGGHEDEHVHGTPDPNAPHPTDFDKQQEHLAVFDLVPRDEATFVSIASGEWSNVAVWEAGVVPGEDAQVLISAGTTVTFDVIQYDPMNWVRVDGVLDWDLDDDTQMLLDTLVVDGKGLLQIGTADHPVEHDVAARIVIADSGEDIDLVNDPLQIGRGVISHGAAKFFGEEVTPYVSLATDPRRGDTQLTLDVIPVNWEAGNRLVLTGTSSDHRNTQDEELEIVSINGNVVVIDADADEPGIQALEYNHLTPEGHDLSVYVANMNRNVVIMSENPAITQRRGHVMFMHNQRVEVENVGFYGLGRTDKRNPANDAVFNGNDELVPGLNQRGRYAVHFHRAGTTYADNPGEVSGSVVVDSPGLGYVNHQSYVNFTQNVAFNVVGSSFFTEFGDEIGSFVGNLAIANTGSGDGLEDRQDIFDFGHGGHGFWLQGPGVEVVDNISTGARDSAFNFFTTSSEAKFKTVNMADPSLAAGRDEVPVGMVPLRNVSGNTAFGSRSGLETWFHQTNSNAGQSYIDDFTAWNVGRGIFNPYTGRTTIRNATLIGNVDRPNGTALGRNNVTNQMTYEDVHVVGWSVGIDVPVNRTTVIRNGYFEAVQAIRISTAHDSLREVDILGDPEFVTLTDSQLRGRSQFDIFMDGQISVKNRDIETYFTPDIVRLGTVRFNNHQAYYHKQAADFVPFPAEAAPDWMPAELIGKTNTELWTQYGIAPGGTIAPEDAVEVDRVNGLVGSRAEYQTRLQLRSAKYTNQLAGYQLRYIDGNGELIVDAAPVDLREGWNLLTRIVNGQTRTFFIFGDVTAPEFRLTMTDEERRANPLGLRHGFVVHGRVFDDSTGDMTFRRRFNDLEERPILTAEDGTQTIELAFTINDLAGNTLDVVVVIILDPDAPLVPGTNQRDLPPRVVPTTLAELIEYYYLTGQDPAELIGG